LIPEKAYTLQKKKGVMLVRFLTLTALLAMTSMLMIFNGGCGSA
jgi:hypothetical protein